MLTPLESDRFLVPLAITTGISDPHELANVISTANYRPKRYQLRLGRPNAGQTSF